MRRKTVKKLELQKERWRRHCPVAQVVAATALARSDEAAAHNMLFYWDHASSWVDMAALNSSLSIETTRHEYILVLQVGY